MLRLWQAVVAWTDRNFTIRGLIGLALFIYSGIPDWIARNQFWKDKTRAILAFLLTPVGRVVLIFLGVLVIWLDHRSVVKKREQESAKDEQPKLAIHSAVYGTGPLDDVPVTDKLRAAARDALVIPVDNNLVSQDPAIGKVKRLKVEYSYGNPSVLGVTRQEGSGRLVLPEDSDILRLASENNRLTQELKATKLAVSNVSQQHKTENVQRRDWSGDWKELSGRFEPLARSGIRADHQNKSGEYERWDITGGDTASADRIKTLCKHAGELLSKSPNVSRGVPNEILATDALDRWLFYLKSAQPNKFRTMGYGIEGGRNISVGSIVDLAVVSANECLECAGKEY